ncbi:MAG: carboxypeptidase regulatory-like domain-containing protein [Planctomycetes bacterium]|nr:carboxypeptidase regulatory-like domain-containing protein [Planctomycetota bacterium]
MTLRAKLAAAFGASLLLVAALALLLLSGRSEAPPGPGVKPAEPLAEVAIDGGEAAPAAERAPAPRPTAEVEEPEARPASEAAPAPRPGWTIAGRVVRPDGSGGLVPAEGVAVLLVNHPRRTRPEDVPPPQRRVTGTDGRFELTGAPAGIAMRIEVDEPSSALRCLSFRLGKPEGEGRRDLGDIPLEPASDLAVQVFGPGGAPVEQASVLVGRDVDQDSPPGQAALTALGFNDSRRDVAEKGGGRYVLERTGPGPHSVRVTARGCAPHREDVDVPRDEPVVVRLLEGRRIAGSVLRGEGKPFAGATVEVDSGPWIGDPDPKTVTDASGRFLFDMLGDGQFSLSATAEGTTRDRNSNVPAGTEDLEFHLAAEAVFAGRVVAEGDGSPVAEATVTLASVIGTSYTGQTDGDGRFRVRKVAAGTYGVTADHDEYGSAAEDPRELQEGQTVEGVVIRLPAGTAASGRVADLDTREPVADAQVDFVLVPPKDGPAGGRALQRRAKTASDGVFEVRGLVPGSWQVSARAKGYLPSKAQTAAIEGEGHEPVEILLEPGASISGRVLDGRGKPIAEATVRPSVSFTSPSEWNVNLGNLFSVSSQTDPEGRYRLEGLSAHGAYTVTASHGEHTTGSVKGLKLGPREALEGVDLTLRRGGTIRGRVTDSRGSLVIGARVQASLEKEGPEAGETPAPSFGAGGGPGASSPATDAEGRYEISRLDPGKYGVKAEAKDRLGASRGGIEVLDERAVEGVDLVLGDGEALAGRVVDAEGSPIAGARVVVSGSSSTQARTDGDGRFRLGGLTAGTHQVNAWQQGFQGASIQAVAPGPEVTLRLTRSAAIAGELRSRRPASFDGSQVMAVAQGTGGGQGTFWGSGAGRDGKFEVEVREGTYVVKAIVRGFAPSSSAPVTVKAGERVEGVVVDLLEGARIEGVVVSAASGEPIEGATVAVRVAPGQDWTASWGLPSAATGAGGDFVLEGVPEGLVSLGAHHKDFADRLVEGLAARVGETLRVRIELAAGGAIRGAVARAGRPAPGLRVLATLTGAIGGAAREAVTGADGSFELKGLAPGIYELRVLAASAGRHTERARRTVEVLEGQTSEVSWEEAVGIRVWGIVTAGGVPMGGGRIQVVQLGREWDLGSSAIGPTGAYSFEVPGPGKYQLLIEAGGRGGAKAEVDVPAGAAEHRHDIDLPSGEVTGIVVDAATGDPVSGVEVVAFDAGAGTGSFARLLEGMKGMGRTDAEGRFTLQSLPPGEYTLRVMARGYAGARVDGVRVGDRSAPPEARIELERGVTLRARVLDPEGRPVAQAMAFLRDAEGSLVLSSRPARSGPDGTLAVEGVRPGAYEVTVVHAAYAPARAAVDAASGEEPAIQLASGGSIAVEVTDRRGRPVEGAFVELLDEKGENVLDAYSFARIAGGPSPAATAADGKAVVGHAAPGKYRVAAATASARSREERVTVEEGKAVEVRLRVEE